MMLILQSLLLLLCVASLFLLFKAGPWLYKVYLIRKSIETFYPCKPHWWKGHMHFNFGPNEKGLKQTLKWITQNPRLFALSHLFRPFLVLCHPETMKIVLKTSEPKGYLPASGRSYFQMKPWLGDGLLLSGGEKWQRNRRLLTPGFHFDILKPYVSIFNDSVETLIRKIEHGSVDGKSMDIFTPVSLCTLNTILRCAFTSNENIQFQRDKERYVKSVVQITKLIKLRQLNPIFFLDGIYFMTAKGKEFLRLCNFTHTVAMDVIRKRQRELQTNKTNNHNRYVDFLDILILATDEEGKGLTDEEIRDEVETFLYEGHDTVSSGLSWALYNLAKYPSYQSKARVEVTKILQNKEYLEWDDLNEFPYLTMCIKESLRMHPPILTIHRELTKPTEFDGHTVEAGTPVELNIWGLHHNPEVWGKDHMTYNPDRFSPNNISNMDSYAFVPFAAGPRNCIGQVFAMNELKTKLARLLYEYEFSVDETHKIEIAPYIVLRPSNGIKVFCKTIQHS